VVTFFFERTWHVFFARYHCQTWGILWRPCWRQPFWQ